MTGVPAERTVARRRMPGRRALAPWALVVVLVIASAAAGAVVIRAVQAIAATFLSLPAFSTNEWFQRIVRLTSQEFGSGILTGALATAAGACIVVALAATALRRGARIASGVWLVPPAVLGAVLVGASVRLAQQASAPDPERVGVTGLLTSPEARGIPTLAETLGFAGVVVLAGVVGCAAVSSRVALVACILAAVALGLGTAAAIGAAVDPIDALLRAPSYPAQTVEPDPVASALGSVLALGAATFVIAALGALAVRERRR